MINSGQVKTKYGNKKDGTPMYGNLQGLITPEIPIQSDEVEFTLGADSNQVSLSGASLPSGSIYVDGSFYEGINGGIICSSGAIGTHSTNTLLVGGRVANISIILSTEDDELIDIVLSATGKVEKRRYIYGLWDTDLTDGDSVLDNKIQLNFVAWDDTTHLLESITIKSGTYKTNANRAYNQGTLAEAKKHGVVLTAYTIGGYAQDELLDLAEDKPMIVEGTLTAEATLQADKKVLITIGSDATGSGLTDSGGGAIASTIYQKETIVFEASDINKTIYEVVGGQIVFNDTIVKASNSIIKTANIIEVDLSNNIATDLLYVNDYIAVTIKGK